MKIIKNKNVKYLLIGIIITLMFFVSTIDSNAQTTKVEPIYYDFNNNVLYEKDNSFNPNMYNVRNQSEYKGNYESYESFDNILTIDELIDWNIYEEGIWSDIVYQDYESGHSNVVLIKDVGDDGYCKLDYTFKEYQTTEQIEMWIYPIRTGEFVIRILDIEVSSGIFITFKDNQITYLTTEHKLLQLYENNFWYHLNIEFNIPNLLWSITINGFLHNNLEFRGNPVLFNEILYQTFELDDNSEFIIDAIDFSWTNFYYKNRNLIPKKEYTNKFEVDKYEFDYNSNDFESDLHSWTRNEYNNTTDDIDVLVSGEQSINKYISVWTPSQIDSYQNGIEFNDDSETRDIINITAQIYFNVIDEWCATIFYIFTKNMHGDYPIGLKFNQYTNNIDVYNITDKSWKTIGSFEIEVMYYINIYLNYYDDIMYISVNSLKVIFPLDNGVEWNGIWGLHKIQINNSMSSMGFISSFYIYNVGIYVKGKYFESIRDYREFGLMIYEIDDEWNSLNHNFITINSLNDYKLYIFTDCARFLCGNNLRERSIQSEKELINMQEFSFFHSLSYLVFQIFDNFTIPHQVEIKGITLINGNNEIFARYDYFCNPDINYFYVINNELHYQFYKYDVIRDVSSTMTISFDIKNVLIANDVNITYTSYINPPYYEGYIDLKTYTEFEQYRIPNSDNVITKSYILTDIVDFTLTEISIKLYAHIVTPGLTAKGYLKDINIWIESPLIPDYDPIAILDLDFLDSMIFIIIRLIFFMIPSLIFRQKFGNKSVIPMWILIGITLFISGLIPFWLFFIQLLAFGGMIMLNKNKEVS